MQPQFFDLANGSPGYFNHPRAASADEQLQLREAHHRIKNDLQIVASLLAIQARVPMDVLAATIHAFPSTTRILNGLFADALRELDEPGSVVKDAPPDED